MALKSLDPIRMEMLKGFPYWSVIINNKTTFVNDEDTQIDSSFESLKEYLSYLDDAFVTVKLSQKTGKEKSEGGSIKSDKTFVVRLNQKADDKAISGYDIGLIKENLELKNENNNLQSKLDQILTRLNAIEGAEEEEYEEEQTHTDAILGMVKPYIPALIAKFVGNSQPAHVPTRSLAGIDGDNEHTSTMDEATEKINRAKKAVIKLLKLDADAAERLEKLAILAETKPDTYIMAANMLNSMI
jgi:citrate synthase